jgi:hypothetical protein
MPSNPLLRAALILTAVGIVSAASVRHSIEETPSELAFAVGYAFYLGLIVLSVPVRPPRWASLLAFVLVGVTYATAVIALQGSAIGIGLYIVAAYLGYLATPALFRPLTVAAFAMWTPAIRFFGPEPLADAFPPALALASVLALINLVASLLDRTATDPDERLRRIGLGLLAVATVATVVERHLVVESLVIAPDDVMALVVVGTLPLLAVVRLRPTTRDALATGLALATFVLAAMALILGKGYHVDAVTVPHVAAQELLKGHDPYVTFDLPAALAQFGLDPELVTHYEDGSALHELNYPAMNFLVVTPFIALGLTDIRWIYLVEVVFMVLLLMRKVRVPWRPIVAAAVVGNTITMRQSVLAGVDPTWALFVLVGWLFIDSAWLSPIALGLAVASRQPAWFVAPFYLVAVWKRAGRGEAIRRGAIMTVAALIPNLPFILADPRAFFDGVTGPMVGALGPHGVGFVRFGVDGSLPLLPREWYGILSATALLFCIAALIRFWRRMPVGAIVFPYVALYFAWRSLQNYFGSVPLLALAGDDELLAGVGAQRTEVSPATVAPRASVPAAAATQVVPPAP